MTHKVLFQAAVLFLLMISCKNDAKKKIEPVSPAETGATIEYNENRFDSIKEDLKDNGSFLGGGGEPFWNVEMTNNIIRFQSAIEKYKVYSAKYSEPEISGNTKTYTSETEEGTIKVTIIKEFCEDGLNGEKNTHKVNVAIKFPSDNDYKNFKGCGTYSVQ